MSEALDQTPIPLILGILFLIGLAADLIGRYTFMPRITLLLLGGLVVGPAGFSLLPNSLLEDWFPALTSIALSLIGFLLGQQISIAELKKHGATIVGISICEVIGAWLAVGLALYAFGAHPVVFLLLAGIAPATAPAATYDVVRESRAKGEFAETLLSVVAVDDIWGLLLFILMMTFAGVSGAGTVATTGIGAGFLEIGGGILLGFALGVPMAYLTGRIRRGEPTLAEAMGFVLLGAGVAEWFGLSSILVAMAMGGTVASLAKHHNRPFHAIEGIEWPFMILFFVLAGASLEVGAIYDVGAVTVIYVLSRCIGMYVGTRLGCQFTGSSLVLRKWLGLALFPQAGVAIGMALLASQRFPDFASIILPVVLTSTIFLEIVAPVITRQALRAAGAIDVAKIRI